jgi:hypothetical protein
VRRPAGRNALPPPCAHTRDFAIRTYTSTEHGSGETGVGDAGGLLARPAGWSQILTHWQWFLTVSFDCTYLRETNTKRCEGCIEWYDDEWRGVDVLSLSTSIAIKVLKR